MESILPRARSFTAAWLILKVTLERFSVETLQAPEVRVLDLVVRKSIAATGSSIAS